jgi:hypothetical protein
MPHRPHSLEPNAAHAKCPLAVGVATKNHCAGAGQEWDRSSEQRPAAKTGSKEAACSEFPLTQPRIRIYGFTDLRISFFRETKTHQGGETSERAPFFCDTDYGFVIRILWIQCTDFTDSVYGFYGFTLIRI